MTKRRQDDKVAGRGMSGVAGRSKVMAAWWWYPTLKSIGTAFILKVIEFISNTFVIPATCFLDLDQDEPDG